MMKSLTRLLFSPILSSSAQSRVSTLGNTHCRLEGTTSAASSVGAAFTSPTHFPRMKNFTKLSFFIGLLLLSYSTLIAQVDVTASGGTPMASYTTLKGAFDAINAGTHTGTITIDISGNTTETATAVLNNSGSGSASYTSVAISPTGSARVIEGTITGAIVKLNGADNVTIDGRIAGSGRNLTIRNNSTSSATAAIWLASVAAGNGVTNSTIRNCEIACGLAQNGSSSSTFGIIMCGTSISSSSNGTDNDNNSFIENRIIKCRYGIVTRGTTTNLNETVTVQNNIVGPTAFGADQIGKVGIFMQADNNATVTGNTVQFVGGDYANTTGGSDRVGIAIGVESWSMAPGTLTSTNYIVSNNTIHDVIEERTFSAVGIILGTTNGGSATNNQVYNNMIYNVKANGTSGDQTAGIGISGGHTDKVVFNSIYLYGDVDPNASASATSNFGSGIRVPNASSSSHANLTLKNNIVHMDLFSSSNSSARYYAISGNSAAYSFGSGGEDNNDLFYNTGNAQCLTGGLGTTSGNTLTTQFTTLANWKTAYTAPQDASSFQVNPSFTSTTNLHLNTGLTPTVLESGGATISGITTDIDSDTRPGPTGSVNGGATAPDIGADEFDGVPAVPMSYVSSTVTQVTGGAFIGVTNQEVIRIEVVTTGDVSPISVTNFDLNANGTTNIADINTSTAKMYYTGASTTFSTAMPFGAGVTPTIATFSITGTQTLVTGSNYFWLAYDVDPAATVSNVIDGECTSITVGSPQTPSTTAPAGNKVILGPMAGNYNVGAAETFPNFKTVTEAVSNLNGRGVSAAVTLTLMDATYNTGAGESFPISINAITGASATNTITLKPGTGVTATITGAAANAALIKLNGTDYFIIDGSNNGSTSRDLTITNSSATSPSAIWLASLGGAGNGASDNTVKNCNLSTAANTSATSFGIVVGSNSIGSSGDDNDNNTLMNNAITGANIGIYAIGNANVSGLGMDNVVIEDNSITVNTTGSTVYGIRVGNSVGGAVTNNTVSVTTTGSTAPVGIALESGYNTGSCNDNKIGPVTTSATGGYGGRGITIGTGMAASLLTIANNEIFGVNGSNWTSFTNSSSMGICIGATPGNSTTLTTTTGGLQIYFNSINLYGNHSFSSATITAGIYVGSAASDLSILNNVFVNSLLNTGASGSKDYGIYSAAANTAYTLIDYNDYFGSATGNSTFFVGYLGSDQATLAAWQTASGQDISSFSADPTFNANTDLTPQLGSPLVAAGIGGTGITTDRIGTARGVTPTVGAYENAADGAAPTITYTALGGTCSTGDRTLTATIVDASGVPTTGALQPRIYFRKNAGTWFSTQGTLSAGSGTSGTWMFSIVAATMGGLAINDQVQYYVIAQDIAAVPNIASNPAAGLVATDVNTVTTAPTSPNSFNIQNTLAAGTYTVGSGGDYATLTAAVTAYNNSCLAGSIVFSLTDATYSGSETFPIVINANGDASATNTLTIRPATGIAATISGASATSGIIKLNGADYVTIDGLNSGGSSLTISNTSATTTSCVVWIGSASVTDGATNNTIRNCSLNGASNTTTVAGIIAGSGSTLGNAAEASNSNNTIANNTIKTAQNGMYLRGEATTLDNGWVVSKNVIGSTVAAEKMSFRGMLIGSAMNMSVDSNTIIGVVSTSTSSATMTGIQVAFATSGGSITRNTIRDIKQINTVGWGSNGIFLAQTSTTANLLVANNFISDVASYGYGSSNTSTDNGFGLMIESGGGYNIYHNTVELNTNQTLVSSTPSVVNISSSITTAGTLDIRNNIFSSTQTVGTRYGVYMQGTSNTIFGSINYNDYSAQNIGYLTTAQATLAAWQTASGQDVNSVNIAPVFASATNLHLPDGSNASLFDLGTPIAGVTVDIDNESRSATAPDMGADEFSPLTLDLTVFIEGYYAGGSTMNSVLLNSGVAGATASQCDTITVELRGNMSPYPVAATFKGVLDTDGFLSCKFPSDKQGGTYFIALKHRNALQTWSGDGTDIPTTFSTSTVSYDFSTDATQAYGSNMIEVETGVWAIYSGDIDDANANGFGDGEIEFQDFDAWVADNGNTGYLRADLNGDGEVEFLDFDIWAANNGFALVIP